MTTTPWLLKGTEYGNCNCDYGCPCQFNGRPSSPDGDCRYAQFTEIDEGPGQVRNFNYDLLNRVTAGGLDGLAESWTRTRGAVGAV